MLTPRQRTPNSGSCCTPSTRSATSTPSQLHGVSPIDEPAGQPIPPRAPAQTATTWPVATDSTWPCSAQVLDEMFENYSAETRDKITRTNVAELYSLSVVAGKPTFERATGT